MALLSKKLTNNVSYFWRLLSTTVLSGVLSLVMVCILLIPGLFYAASANDSAREEQLLMSSLNWMDEALGSLDNCRNRVENSDWLYELYIRYVLDGKSISDIKEHIVADLSLAVALENGVVDQLSFRFDQQPDTLFTSGGVYQNIGFFQKQYPDNLLYYFVPLEKGAPGLRTEQFQGRPVVVSCAQFITVAHGMAKGTVMVVLDEANICEKLRVLTSGDVAAVQVLDKAGNLLWERSLFETSEKLHFSEISSEANGYIYRIGILQSVFHQTRSRVLSLSIISILIVVAACTLISSRLAHASYAPVKTLSEKYLNAHETKQEDELSALGNTIEHIVSKQSEYKAALDQLRPLAQQRIIDSLLSGSIRLSNGSSEQKQYIRSLFRYSKYMVAAVACIVPWNGSEEEKKTPLGYMEIIMETLLDRLLSEMPVSTYLYFLDSKRYRILFNADSVSDIRESMQKINDNYQVFFKEHEIEMELRFGVGSVVDSLDMVYLSSEQALTTLNLAAGQYETGLVFYDEFEKQVNKGYYYPLSMETLLLQAIVENGPETAKSILNDIIETNRNRAFLSYNSHSLLFINLCLTITRSMQSVGIFTDIVPETHYMNQAMSLSMIQSRVSKMIDDACESIAKARNKRYATAEEQFVEFTNQNLYDPNLSLSQIADRFQKSTAFVSIGFKKVTGMNFSTYVNQGRIIRATELLLQGGLSLEEVSRAVGYVSLSTFRRNFNKYAKTNPSDFAAEKRNDDAKEDVDL